MRIILFTGAGSSASSGIPTFRSLDGKGFWGKFEVNQVCSAEALRSNPDQVIKFYRELREQIRAVNPSSFHLKVRDWQKDLAARGDELLVITQNVDNLFERAGVENVSHVHGEIIYSRCQAYNHRWLSGYEDQTCPVCSVNGDETNTRPDVVLFGEPAPAYAEAKRVLRELTEQDYLIVCGTSLGVFPIAALYGTRARIIWNNTIEPDRMVSRLYRKIISPCEDSIEAMKEATNSWVP